MNKQILVFTPTGGTISVQADGSGAVNSSQTIPAMWLFP